MKLSQYKKYNHNDPTIIQKRNKTIKINSVVERVAIILRPPPQEKKTEENETRPKIFTVATSSEIFDFKERKQTLLAEVFIIVASVVNGTISLQDRGTVAKEAGTGDK